MSKTLLLLNAAEIGALLTADEVVATQREAFTALSNGQAVLGERVLLPGSEDSVAFSYAARMSVDAAAVAKFGSVVPGNRRRGLPSVGAIVTMLDAVTGQPVAVLDGEAVTALRTVAASAAAVDALAPQSRDLAVLGWGMQGRRHAQLLSTRLGARSVRVYDPGATAADLAIGGVAGEVRLCSSAKECVAGADLVITCTTSLTPIVSSEWLRDTRLVLTVGSFAPDRHEVGTDVVQSRRVVVDHVPTALRQYGPVVAAVGEGVLAPDQVTGIGDVLTGRVILPADQPVLYGSVGVGIQDAAVVELVVERARASGRGTPLPW